MKRLMIVCAAVMMACAANAAAASWQWRLGMSTVVSTDAKGTVANGNGIWMLNNANTGAAAVLTALRSYSTVSAMETYLDGVAIDSANLTSAGKMGSYQPSATGKNSYTELGTLDASSKANLYVVILGNDGKSAFISDLTSTTVKTADGNNTTINFISVGADSKTDTLGYSTAYSEGGWYALSNVPEPTSGLLLLIGMAGLALKRKRA